MASAVRLVALPASASNQIGPQGSTINLTYLGFTVYGAAACVIRIRKDGIVGGDILETISLAAGQSAGEWYGPQGLNAGTGIYIEKVSGTMPEGSVRVF